MPQTVTITYLEMKSPDWLRRKSTPEGAVVEPVPRPMPDWNRDFYVTIGGEYDWTDRLPWSREQWLAYLSQPGVETWILSVGGSRAGYFELVPQTDGAIDIAYFGLLPAYTGQGFGGSLLTVAVDRAWEKGANRVTVNTCTCDHPAALSHYLARGFRIAGTQIKGGPYRPVND